MVTGTYMYEKGFSSQMVYIGLPALPYHVSPNCVVKEWAVTKESGSVCGDRNVEQWKTIEGL